MSDYVSREALTSVTRAGSQGLEGENPDKFPYEAFEVDASDSKHKILRLTAGWYFSHEYKGAIGIPQMWFSELPDWALAFDDGSGPYDWEDYPELDNEDFKEMLTIWSSAGWMPVYTETHFYVPDLKGLFPRISGTNAIRSSVYAGGNLAAYLAHQFEQHQHNHTHGLGYSTDDHAHSPFNMAQGSNDRSYTYYVDYSAPNASSGNRGTETRPGSFSLRLIVRFK